MKFLNLIYKYLTDKDFREFIENVTDIFNNTDGIADVIDDQINVFKKTIISKRENRINKLSECLDQIKQMPTLTSSSAVKNNIMSQINNVLNEMKADLINGE